MCFSIEMRRGPAFGARGARSAWPLDTARATLNTYGDHVNAANALKIGVRRLLPIGHLDETGRAFAGLDPVTFPPALKTADELVVAGIAMRRLRTTTARATVARTDGTIYRKLAADCRISSNR